MGTSLVTQVMRFWDKLKPRWVQTKAGKKFIPYTVDELMEVTMKEFVADIAEVNYYTGIGEEVLFHVKGDPNKFIEWLENNEEASSKYVKGPAERAKLVDEYNTRIENPVNNFKGVE